MLHRRWEKTKKKVKYCETPTSVRKEGEEVLQVLRQTFPCRLCWRAWWFRLSPCSQGPPWSRYAHCSPRMIPCRWIGPKGSCSLWRTYAGAGSWQELQPVERSSCRTKFYGRTCKPLGDLHCSSPFLKDCTLWKGPTLEHFVKDCVS